MGLKCCFVSSGERVSSVSTYGKYRWVSFPLWFSRCVVFPRYRERIDHCDRQIRSKHLVSRGGSDEGFVELVRFLFYCPSGGLTFCIGF